MPVEPQEPRPIRVGIGLIARASRYLIRRRPPGGPMPGLWEFPGGKCEPGETPGAAAVRECGEEAGFAVLLGRLRRVTRHEYPHGLVELWYYDCPPAEPNAEPPPGSGFVWVAARDLPSYRFPDANEPLIAELVHAAGC